MKIIFDKEQLDKFYKFITERQEIWKRRIELHMPREYWTKDKILQTYRFCNIYRELDRGTIYAREAILKKKDDGIDNIIFNLLIYRMFNLPSTHRALGFTRIGKFDYDTARAALQDLAERRSVFNTAYMTCAAGMAGDGQKTVGYCRFFAKLQWKMNNIVPRIAAAKSMEKAWLEVTKIKYFGGFIAYQVVLDLAMIRPFKLRWDMDAWVYPGPGAMAGLNRMLKHHPLRKYDKGADKKRRYGWKIYEHAIRALTAKARTDLNEYKFYYLREDGKKKYLNVHDIEFALCEFNKYQRAGEGGKKTKRFVL